MEDYFAPGPAPPPAGELAPARTVHRRWLIGSLTALLVLTASSAVLSVNRARAAAAPALRPVTAPAPAEDGWGPSYVDSRGRPARWNPCAPIHLVVDTRWMPVGGRADLAAALAQLSSVSGLTFTDDGDTDEVPLRTRESYQPRRYGDRWAPVLVGWVPAADTDLGLGHGVQGITVAVALSGRDGGAIVTAQVALDADHRLPGGFGPGATEGEVLLHELGHAVGLGHVLDPTQVMYPQTTNSESEYGAGDRAGLRALGRDGGCLRTPAPRPLPADLGDSRT